MSDTQIAPQTAPPPRDNWSRAGAFFVTVAIFGLFFWGLQIASQAPTLPPAAGNLLETIKALSLVAAGYWLGTSASSAKKDDSNAQTTAVAMQALANSAPVAPTTPAPPAST